MKIKDKPARPRIILLVICVLVSVSIIPRVKTVWELSAQRAQLEQQKAALQKINQELTIKAREANSKENIEKIAREQLGMVKKGEKALIKVIPEK
jgi:cell division protein FtsL